jgi:signal transduction histidine kinase
MVDLISCPQCARLVDPQARYCEHCGVDLPLAAVMAEQAVINPTNIPEGVPIAPEILVPRIGDYLIEKGLLHPEELQIALNYQRENIAKGCPILVGQALLEKGLISREALDQAITTQILQLQTALSESNQQLEQRVQERTTELQRALDRVAELNQLKSNFIANISHELRTPLTHLKGYLDLLVNGGLGDLNDQQISAINVLLKSEARLEQLIEDLLQFSLASRGELSLNLKATHISELFHVIIERSKQKARSRAISLGVILPEDILAIHADEEKINWVMAQLVDNALKFTPKGGRVEVEALVEDSVVTLAVTDTGIGIPAERIAEIFEPFHQLDGSPTRRYGGTGLGLAMVRRIIEAHGSQIKVLSVVGHGSRFEFSMPVTIDTTS